MNEKIKSQIITDIKNLYKEFKHRACFRKIIHLEQGVEIDLFLNYNHPEFHIDENKSKTNFKNEHLNFLIIQDAHDNPDIINCLEKEEEKIHIYIKHKAAELLTKYPEILEYEGAYDFVATLNKIPNEEQLVKEINKLIEL